MDTRLRLVNQPAAVFRFGEFTYDCGSRLLHRAGVIRHLSLKAQQLLQLLLEVRPRALSREELYDALWPDTYVCETNLANVVNEIRRALNDDARASQYVRTVHGFGYAFCGDAVAVSQAVAEVVTLLCEGKSKHLLQEGENAIGRAPGQILIADHTISRRHAILTLDCGALTIRDLHSTNGTYVDGQRIGRTPVVVTPRSRIELGLVVVTILHRRLSSTSSLLLSKESLRRAVSGTLEQSGERNAPQKKSSAQRW